MVLSRNNDRGRHDTLVVSVCRETRPHTPSHDRIDDDDDFGQVRRGIEPFVDVNTGTGAHEFGRISDCFVTCVLGGLRRGASAGALPEVDCVPTAGSRFHSWLLLPPPPTTATAPPHPLLFVAPVVSLLLPLAPSPSIVSFHPLPALFGGVEASTLSWRALVGVYGDGVMVWCGGAVTDRRIGRVVRLKQ